MKKAILNLLLAFLFIGNLSAQNKRAIASTAHGYDVNALAWIKAEHVGSECSKRAVSNFCERAKLHGYWSNLLIIQPFSGWFYSTYNLKDTSAFKMVYNGSWTNMAPYGYKGDGSTTYATMSFTPSVSLPQSTGFSFGLYSWGDFYKTATTWDFGTYGHSNYVYLDMLEHDGGHSDDVFGGMLSDSGSTYTSLNGGSMADTKGMYIVNKLSNKLTLDRNGIQLATTTTTLTAMPNVALYLGAFNAGSLFYSTPRQYAFWTVGTGLTLQQRKDLTADVQAFQAEYRSANPYMLFIGDSFTEGQGTSEQLDSNWVTIFTKAKSITRFNLAAGGQTLIQGTGNAYNYALLPYKSNVVNKIFFSWGINDCVAAGQDSTTYLTALTAFYDSCLVHGFVASDLYTISGYLLSTASIASGPKYPSFVRTAERYWTSVGVKYYNPTAYELANGGQTLMWQNGVGGANANHPNTTGHKIIANYIIANYPN